MIKFSDYTKAHIIVHWMPWHGYPGHVPFTYTLSNGNAVPYISSDIRICDDQCAKMKAAGVAAINVDYYGPEHVTALASIRMLSACERAGLGFSLCIDQGAVSNANDKTAEYIRILNIAKDMFFSSPFYLRDPGNRAMVSFFGDPPPPLVNWTTVRTGVITPMAMMFQNGFTHPEADGVFGWVSLGSGVNDINLGYLNWFIAEAAQNPGKIIWYPAYPGFDDSLASWGKQRVMTRSHGKTIRTTIGAIPGEFGLVSTWNDHEEDSNVEEGVRVA